MGFMDGVSTFTRGVGQKAKGNYDIVTMNNRIVSLQKEIRKICLQIGEKYYTIHKDDPEPELESLVKAIQNLETQITDISRQVENTKAVTAAVQLVPSAGTMPSDADGGNGFCASCGAPLLKDSVFCVKCGAKVSTEEDAANGESAGQDV